MPDHSPAFDSAASSYDLDFTDSAVGRLQRNLVQEFLLEKNLVGPGQSVLEVNCGTGADAIWMAEQGSDVLATDLSGEMVALATQKWEQSSKGPGTARFQQLDLQNVHQVEGTFDLIFSNFGGLNCVSPADLKAFFAKIPQLIPKEGTFVGVIMPQFCFLETLYFFSKFKFREAYRRKSQGPVAAPLGNGTFQDTWYYRPRWVRESIFEVDAQDRNMMIDIRPIGFFLPPSYLDPFFKKRPKLLARLNRWEYGVRRNSWLAARSDHFLIAVHFFC